MRTPRLFSLVLLFLFCDALFPGNESVRAETAGDSPAARPSPGAELFSRVAVHRFNIELRPEAARSLRREPRRYVLANVGIDGVVYTNVEIHLKGSIGSFRPLDDKPGLTLSFAESKASARFARLKKFHLNNSVQDPTYLSELICSELFRAAGVPATRVTHAWVKLNGRTLGLYTLKEAFNHEFLANYFKNTRGNLYGQSGGGDITEPLERIQGDGQNTHSDLKLLAAAARERDPVQRWDRLQRVLDVDRFLSFLAMEVLLCHWDGYTFSQHNYRVYHDLDSDKMVFFPHDMDQMLGDPNTPILPNANGLVCQAVLTIPEARRQYRERFGTLFTNVFQVPALTKRIDSLVAELTPSLRKVDPNLANAFGPLASSLKQRIAQRHSAALRQLQTPEPKPLRFQNGIAAVAGWRTQVDEGRMSVERTQSAQGQFLRINCERGGGVASWRTSVLLEPGRYQFRGRAKAAGVLARRDPSGTGGGLRISGDQRQNQLVGNSEWVELSHPFVVTTPLSEVVLVCELRAVQGEIWFDLASLQLRQLPSRLR